MPDPTPDETVEITLGERTYTLRPALAELKALQKKCGGLIALFEKFRRGEALIEDAAAVIYHGIAGAGQTPPPLASLEQAVFDEGLVHVARPIVNLLAAVLADGPRSGTAKKEKAELAAKAAEAAQQPS